MVNHPYLYDSFVSSALSVHVPSFVSWIQNVRSPYENVTNTFSSSAGVNYTQFAKSASWGKDLYDDFVAVVLNEDIYVETWRSGSGGRYVL